jgi:hypothetical protein
MDEQMSQAQKAVNEAFKARADAWGKRLSMTSEEKQKFAVDITPGPRG